MRLDLLNNAAHRGGLIHCIGYRFTELMGSKGKPLEVSEPNLYNRGGPQAYARIQLVWEHF
jgi:hypothetical protein